MKKTIEAEGNELVLKNKAGDYVIIPKKYRVEVQDMIDNNCHSCIDALVETLPIAKDYAKDGTIVVVPDDKKPIEKPIEKTTKTKVKLTNDDVKKEFTESEIYYWTDKDVNQQQQDPQRQRLNAQAKYNYYAKQIEDSLLKDNPKYKTFKEQLPSKLTDRFKYAEEFAKNTENQDFYIKDEDLKKLFKDKFEDYSNTKREIEKIRNFKTEGTDDFTTAFGARSMSLNIPTKLLVSPKTQNDGKLIRDYQYSVEYDPNEDSYIYTLLSAKKGEKYEFNITK